MNRFFIEDNIGNRLEIVEERGFCGVPARNYALRKEDFMEKGEEVLFYGETCPIFISVNKKSIKKYMREGIYDLQILNMVRSLLTLRLDTLIYDRFKEERFLYDSKLRPIERPFEIILNGNEWPIYKIENELKDFLQVSNVENKYDKLTFLYHSEGIEFDRLHLDCVRYGFSQEIILSHVIKELDIGKFYKGEES